MKRSLKDNLYLYFTGICMGAADVVPGVSGGTMAFIMGIYEELLNAIKSVDLKFFQLLLRFKIKEIFNHVPWQFLLVLLLGIASAVLSLAHGITWALEHRTEHLYAFFFGLILASIMALAVGFRWKLGHIASALLGTGLGWIIVGLVPLDSGHSLPLLFFSGMIAIMAMILPGISGSFILLILGQYEFIMNAVKELDLITVAVVGAGAVAGLMVFARILSWLLSRWHNLTLALLIGFMAGSLRKIWPFREVTEQLVKPDGEIIPIAENLLAPPWGNAMVLEALGLALFGFFVLSLIDHIHTKRNPLFCLFVKK